MTGVRPRGIWVSVTTAFSVVVLSVSTLAAMGAGEIRGTIFTDIAGDGLADGSIGSTANPGISAAAVRIFHDDGPSPGTPDSGDTELAGGAILTAADGTFSASSLADGDYWVAVDSTSFGLGGTWSEQTWGPTAPVPLGATAATTGPRYGGRSPTTSDGLTSGLQNAEHLAFVSLNGAPVSGVDFGFSFNVVTRTGAGGTQDDHVDTGRTVQGSLRQFLTNANAIGGPNRMRFVPMTPSNATDAGPVHEITITSALPSILDDDTTVDGTVYASGGATLDINPGMVGSPAATVGVGGLAPPTTPRPDLVLTGSGVGIGLAVDDAEEATIRGVWLRGFTTAALSLTQAEEALVEDNVIGGATDPGSGRRNGIGIEITGGSDGTIDSNTVAHNGSAGINVPGGAIGWTISANDVNGNGLENSWGDQVRLVGGSDFTLTGNHIRNGRQVGIEIRVGVGAVTADNNTIEANGAGGGEIAGVRNINELAQPMTISNNVIISNVGPGVLVSRDGPSVGAPSLMTITGNRFGGNGGMAVDLTTSDAGRIAGDGPNALSGNGCGTGLEANAGVDRPVITAAYAPGPYLRIVGSGCPGSTVELYTASATGNDTFAAVAHGEPITRIGTTTVAGDGSIDVLLPAGPAVGNALTALATDSAGNTSEPAANVTATGANIPSITLLGANPLAVEAGGTYTDPGATALDVEDGDLSSFITIDAPVDPGTIGSYTVTYDVTDSAGFPAVTVSRSVQVADTTRPTIRLIGSATRTIEGGSTYVDRGATATDSFEGNLTSSIVTTGAIDTFTLGPQIITYSVADSSGNTATRNRTVTVVDTTPPSLTVNGPLSLIVTQDSTYVDAGASAADIVDGNLTGAIVVSGTVDTAVLGTYVLEFDVADTSGNAAPTVTRTVVVTDPNPPTISINGARTVTVEALIGYVDAGATATDIEDGDLTAEIVTTNRVDPDEPGTYTVTYSVSDASGNRASTSRTVRVVDTTPPTLQLLGEDPFRLPAGHAFTDPGAVATDLVDGPVPIVISGTVDTAVANTTTLTYTATDAAGNATSLTRAVEVLPNHAPAVANESYRIDQGEQISIAAPGLLANDTDPEDDELTVTVVSQPADGVLTLTPDGAFTYQHGDRRDAADTFTYAVTDSYGNVTIGRVTFTVTLANRAPSTVADTATTSEDTTLVMTPIANDFDPDGDPLHLVSVTGANGGITIISGDRIHFTPADNWHGTLTMAYSVTDGFVTVSETISVTVTPVNDPPIPVGDHVSTDRWNEMLLSVIANDRDPDGDVISLLSVSTPEYGSARVVGDMIEYSPRIGYWGTDQFTYTVSDEAGATGVGTVTISISRPEWVAAAVVDGGGSLIAAGPDGGGGIADRWDGVPRAQAIILFVGAFLQQLLAQSVHLALLALALLWFVLFGYSQWRRAAVKGKRYAVVLLDREERLDVFAEAGGTEVTERLDAAERRIRSAGRARKLNGITWIPIETANGTGWVDGTFLTEDAARATFERDVEHRHMIASMREALVDGRRPRVSGRGPLDPVTLRRMKSSTLPLTAAEARMIAEAIADPAAEILVDELHAPDSLRPAQLRNFHWITVVTGDSAWHLFFEYHRNAPALVAVRPEGAPLPKLV